jgi:hypothetical protein
MILHIGERVYWGAPDVIYLEGTITSLDEQAQTVIVHVDRSTSHSAHLIDTDMSFSADGVKPLVGESPSGTTTVRSTETPPAPVLSDDEKIQRAAAAAVYQQYGPTLPEEQKKSLIAQVVEALNSDPTIRAQIITSMDEILRREH